MDQIIRVGTRKSKLAMWQTEWVCKRLNEAGLKTEIMPIDTKGDKILDVAISKIGSKGVFTDEIESKPASGDIDIAVHSAKDMASHLPDGFELIAFTQREKVNDVLVSHKKVDLTDNAIVIGTSSTRRVAILKKHYPHIKTVDIRGNLQTRIAKMESGHCDALLLAYAGVHRMAYDRMIVATLDTKEFTPAVGQGSIAIEASNTLNENKKGKIKKALSHRETEWCIGAERAFLRKLKGGCSIPAFANTTLIGDRLYMKAGIYSLDGSKSVRTEQSDIKTNGEKLGVWVAEQLLSQGGDKILEEIKKTLNT